jgi:ADP-heptose:LPS heptosyltransferase
MKKILIFRTDRVGDFLLSLSLIKIIKLNYPDAEINLVSSEKNHNYIRTFKDIDNINLLKNNILSKIKLILHLRKIKYDYIIVHDGKKRSKFISFFLKYKKRIICVTNLIDTQIDIIKKVCNKIQLNFRNECLDFLDNRKHSLINIPFNSYIHFHFDEKWTHSEYIKKYKNIEPNENEFISFINNIVMKDRNLIITTGKKQSKLLHNIKNKINSEKVKIYENQSLIEIENIVFNSELLISCHGWISHIASAKKIKQIDIIDNQYPYDKWTSHFRNYNYLDRNSFENLSQKILDFI